MKYRDHEIEQEDLPAKVNICFSPRYFGRISGAGYWEKHFRYEIRGKHSKPAHVDPILTNLEDALDWLNHEIERNR